jgi:hypothetical protein
LGVFYPEVGIAAGAHHILAAAIHPSASLLHPDAFAGKDRFAYFGELVDQIVQDAGTTPAPKIFVSSEYLWGQYGEAVFNNLRRLTEKFNAHVLCYVRRQDEWLESTYAQAVKSGETRTFREWLFASLDKGHAICHYDKILAQWEKLIPAANIHVKVYGSGGVSNSISDCLNFLGIEDTADLNFPRCTINPTPSAIDTEIIRQVNASPLSSANKQKISELLRKRSQKKQAHTRLFYLSANETLELLKRYEAGNEAVAKRYLQDGTKQLFGAPPQRDEWPAWEGPSAAECANIMIGLAAELLERK